MVNSFNIIIMFIRLKFNSETARLWFAVERRVPTLVERAVCINIKNQGRRISSSEGVFLKFISFQQNYLPISFLFETNTYIFKNRFITLFVINKIFSWKNSFLLNSSIFY